MFSKSKCFKQNGEGVLYSTVGQEKLVLELIGGTLLTAWVGTASCLLPPLLTAIVSRHPGSMVQPTVAKKIVGSTSPDRVGT